MAALIHSHALQVLHIFTLQMLKYVNIVTPHALLLQFFVGVSTFTHMFGLCLLKCFLEINWEVRETRPIDGF